MKIYNCLHTDDVLEREWRILFIYFFNLVEEILTISYLTTLRVYEIIPPNGH